MLHICTEVFQPATDWTDTHSGEPMRMGFEPEKLIYTDCCGKQRRAKDCVVQCYYDGLSIWCAPEKGCKDPLVIAKKKAQEFANRSAGQKARWAKASNVEFTGAGRVYGLRPVE
ncbi:MAG: hypothetical protein ACRCV5_06255 [Afipia sp.]